MIKVYCPYQGGEIEIADDTFKCSYCDECDFCTEDEEDILENDLQQTLISTLNKWLEDKKISSEKIAIYYSDDGNPDLEDILNHLVIELYN